MRKSSHDSAYALYAYFPASNTLIWMLVGQASIVYAGVFALPGVRQKVTHAAAVAAGLAVALIPVSVLLVRATVDRTPA